MQNSLLENLEKRQNQRNELKARLDRSLPKKEDHLGYKMRKYDDACKRDLKALAKQRMKDRKVRILRAEFVGQD